MTGQSFAPARAWAWAALSLVGYVVSFAMAFLIVTSAEAIGILPAEVAGLRVDLGLLLGLHGAFAAGTVLPAAWLTLGTWPAVTARQAALPVLGVALAVASELALHEWAEARYGYYDGEFIGWTALLSIILVGAAVATFGVIVAPRGAVSAPLGALLVASAGVILIVLANLRGLGDGIGPGGWPLAVVVGLSAVYVLVAVALGVRRLRSG